MSNTQDRKSGLPPEEPEDELEEALKWLEELTNRKGATPETATSAPSATLGSPFHGLIEDDKGDLPDWLRETPSAPDLENIADTELESRLDWLAKMAQRESIEELPTLEWRRIGGPMQSALMPPTRMDISEPEESDATIMESPHDPTGMPESSELGELSSQLEPDNQETATPDVAEAPRRDESQDSENIAATVEFDPGDEPPSADDLDAAMAWIEELAASQNAPIEDIPSVVDRALASKIMMEMGISHPASPLDELGSATDLGIETSTHPFIEEEDLADTVILVETMAAEQKPVSESTDGEDEAAELADYQPVAVEPEEHEVVIETETYEVATEPGTHEATVEPEAEVATEPEVREDIVEPEAREIVIESDTSEFAGLYEPPPDALSFEEAMAYLDSIAVEPKLEWEAEEARGPDTPTHDEAIAIEITGPLPNLEAQTSELVADEFDSISQLAAQAEELVIENIAPFAEDMELGVGQFKSTIGAGTEAVAITNGDALSSLEAALLALDTMAIPDSETPGDIALSPQSIQGAPTRDISSALDWLESALAAEQSAQTTLDEEAKEQDLFAQMPEDPDAVLAWLEKMIEEDAESERSAILVEDSSPAYTSGQHIAGPAVENLAVADLLSMPDDPDEAMAWLEGLARGGDSAGEKPMAERDEGAIDSAAIPAVIETEFEKSLSESAETTTVETEIVISEAEAIDDAPGTLTAESLEMAVEQSQTTEREIAIAPDASLDKGIIDPVEAAMKEIEAIADEMLATGEAPRSKEPLELSWIDLLKPLD